MSEKTIIIACSGLGEIKRGFESFSYELREALSNYPGKVILVGRKDGDTTAFGLSRLRKSAALLGRLFSKDSYWIEQFSFAIGLVPLILRNPDSIIYSADGTTLNALWHIRRIFRLKFRLILSNAAPFFPPFAKADYIQHCTPETIKTFSNNPRHCLLPYGFKISEKENTYREMKDLRAELSLPQDIPIILSVGAIGTNHKRHEFLIESVSKLKQVSPHLLIIGQKEEGYEEIVTLGEKLLGKQFTFVFDLPQKQLSKYYQASNLFSLCSLSEGFGRVIVEALSFRLPVIIHESENFKDLFGELASYCDMQELDSLINFLENFDYTQRTADINFAETIKRFDWSNLSKEYYQIFDDVGALEPLYTTSNFRREICPV